VNVSFVFEVQGDLLQDLPLRLGQNQIIPTRVGLDALREIGKA
jgi:hypothetical protein